MGGIAERLRSRRARWSESRARKREREARAARASAKRDPNPGLARRHGESFQEDPHWGGGA
jgi:hypothetical protein